MADGVWEDRREHIREANASSNRETPGEPLEARPAANDNIRGQVCEDSRIIFYSLGFVRANLGKS